MRVATADTLVDLPDSVPTLPKIEAVSARTMSELQHQLPTRIATGIGLDRRQEFITYFDPLDRLDLDRLAKTDVRSGHNKLIDTTDFWLSTVCAVKYQSPPTEPPL